eukprot:CAMPEP_0206221688 /NCGR_PEP_ID=MMETSP0047_2-20121206/5552_1 /ASSEMBLY_ACC=CAM_ASM_000192 /TAXON_ID=195065 /ORGANISM="Chroomonas mesostigmatica_cf, Strain CCMP1168" /LENGTH=133 /DNA_ID=CAMNT_0053644447 /DNA_START=92 /DNA_END=493 /DNA_ORIENTATION=-
MKGAPGPPCSATSPAISGAATLHSDEALSKYPIASPCIHSGASLERKEGGQLRSTDSATAKIGMHSKIPNFVAWNESSADASANSEIPQMRRVLSLTPRDFARYGITSPEEIAASAAVTELTLPRNARPSPML